MSVNLSPQVLSSGNLSPQVVSSVGKLFYLVALGAKLVRHIVATRGKSKTGPLIRTRTHYGKSVSAASLKGRKPF